MVQNSGVKWLRHYRENISPLGEKVASVLDELASGIYHCSDYILKPRTQWHDNYCIEIVLRSLSFYHLTCLVKSCEKNGVTVAVTGAAPNFIRLRFWHKK